MSDLNYLYLLSRSPRTPTGRNVAHSGSGRILRVFGRPIPRSSRCDWMACTVDALIVKPASLNSRVTSRSASVRSPSIRAQSFGSFAAHLRGWSKMCSSPLEGRKGRPRHVTLAHDVSRAERGEPPRTKLTTLASAGAFEVPALPRLSLVSSKNWKGHLRSFSYFKIFV